MHPRITRLYVNNYRSFVNFELRPGRRSLLLGYNGTGKSSVFDVLHGIRALVIGNNDIKHVFPTDTVTKFGGSPEQRFDPRAPLSPIASFKSFLEACWILRLDPVRMNASAPSEDGFLLGSGVNFASYCRHILQESPENMQRAHDALREIIPGFQHLRTQSAGRSKVLVATFRYPAGSTYDLDFDSLSDGQRTLIVLYVVLFCAAHGIPLICLDEPDNFVSIREIQPFLTELSSISDETGLQVILISHSPEVIDYIGSEGAILVERPDGGHTRTGTLPSGGALRLSELMARGWLSGGS